MRIPFIRQPGMGAAAVALACLALACTQIPLLNALGYESSLAFAFAGSFIAGFLVIGGVRRFLRAEGDPQGNAGWTQQRILALFFRRTAGAFLLLLIPLAILSLNALFVKNCSFTQGLGFFLLLPAVSVWFASALGLFCAVHYRFSRIIFLLLFAATLAYALLLGYVTPAIFSYNFFYGYFPGFSYDEALAITPSLIFFRVLTLALGGGLLWLALLIVGGSSRTDRTVAKGIALFRTLASQEWRVVSGAIAAAIVLLYLFRCALGWESTAGYIADQLGGTVTTAHFTIHYPAEKFTEADVQRIKGEHEFRLMQLMRDFGVEDQEPITSFIYPDPETKRELMGAGVTEIAKPWNNEVHCMAQSLERALKHELAHVVVGRFGLPVIRVSLRGGLVEGVATAQELTWGTRTLHQHAAAMRESGMLPDIRRIMTLSGFVSGSTSASYVTAGSFCRYLIDAYGMKPLLAVYGGEEFDAAFGNSLDGLVTEWNRFLGRLRVEEGDTIAATVLFRRPTIFAKTCARVTAQRLTDAEELMRRREYLPAREAYRAAYEEAGGMEAFAGLLAASYRAGDRAEVIRLYDSVIVRDRTPARYLPLFLLCGDARWAGGDPAGARELYGRVRVADVSESLTEGAAVRLAAMRDTARAAGWIRYFLAEPADSIRVKILDSLAVPADTATGLTSYLRGRILANAGKPVEALEVLERLTLGGQSPTLESYRQTAVARQWYQLGKYEAARAAFWMSQNVLMSEASVMRAREWASRCEWIRNHVR